MEKKYEILRAKMSKFNEWEAKHRKDLKTVDRLEQFFALYDLGRWHSDGVLRQMHENHLMALINTHKRLRDSKIRLEKKKNKTQKLFMSLEENKGE